MINSIDNKFDTTRTQITETAPAQRTLSIHPLDLIFDLKILPCNEDTCVELLTL